VPYAEYRYGGCRGLFIVMLSVVMLSVVMLSVVMLSVITVSVVAPASSGLYETGSDGSAC
jgi:hypothetical protein